MFALTVLLPILVTSFLTYNYLVYPIFLSPLSKIPNAHLTSSFCPAWIFWVRYRGIENRTLLFCHDRLGEVIRLGPNDISVNCVDGGIRTVYGGGFPKPSWYAMFANYGVPNMFSTIESKSHSIRKRLISHVYSKSYLQNSTAMHELSQTLIFERFLPLLDSLSRNGSAVDVLELNFAVAMDFITAYLFGLASGSNFLQDVEYRKHWLNLYHTRDGWRFWPRALPTVDWLLHKLGFSLVPDKVNAANREIESWCHGMSEATRTQPMDIEKANTSSPVVYTQLAQSLEKFGLNSDENSPPSHQDLAISSEMLDHSAAGFETSGITMTYIMHFLSQRPKLQSSLRDELLQLSPNLLYQTKSTETHSPSATSTNTELPLPRSLDNLPLLHAIIMETLRLASAIPGQQPRLTPHNPPTPTNLGGYSNIPGGVRVSSQTCTLHRNPVVFPDPETWKPERWLEAGKEAKEEMMRWFWSFSSGGKMCIGSHFAMQEMKLIIAAVYTNFTTSIIDDRGMEQRDGYVGRPISNKLILRFARAV